MKLASYEINGRRSYGVVTDQEVLDIGGQSGAPATLRDALAVPHGSLLEILAEATSRGSSGFAPSD